MAPIHHAASDGDAETLRQLLESGESPDALYHETAFYLTQTPLHCLCERNVGDRAACFELLRDAGANLEASDSERNRPLHYAAERGHLELVSLLVQARVNVDATGNHGATALHLAARFLHGRTNDCVDVLLARGASVNARDRHGRTPFDMALPHNRRRVWPLLLRAGAEIPTDNTDPYIVRVRNAGGFKKYAQAHLARITAILAPTPRLPPEMVRKIVEFWLHAGYY